METKYQKGDKVFCKEQRSFGTVVKILNFFNEGCILYKVNIDDKMVLLFEEQLDYNNTNSFSRTN